MSKGAWGWQELGVPRTLYVVSTSIHVHRSHQARSGHKNVRNGSERHTAYGTRVMSVLSMLRFAAIKAHYTLECIFCHR